MAKARRRRRIAALLKKRGLGKLYYGNKKAAFKWVNLAAIENALKYAPGDVVNDCDMFNHVVEGYRTHYNARKYGKALILDQVTFTDGRWSCGCGGLEAPWPVEKILEIWCMPASEEPPPAGVTYRTSEFEQALIDANKNGQPIVDDRGVLLEQFGRLKRW